MKKIAILGLLIITMPFLGFPNSWDKIIYIILGSIIFIQSLYSFRKMNSTTNKQEKKLQSNIYVENGDYSIEGKQ